MHNTEAKENVTNFLPDRLAACYMSSGVQVRLQNQLPGVADAIVVE